MRLPIRYFSIGLLTASIAILISFSFFHESSADLENESIDNITSFLENEGYKVITQDEYITLSVNKTGNEDEPEKDDDSSNADTNNDDNEEVGNDKNENKSDENVEDDQDKQDGKDAEKDKDKTDKKENNKPKVVKYTLHVEPNMLAPTVSKILYDNKIIDDAEAFAQYLLDEGYSRYIQLGDHELTSDMSFSELAKKITNN